jgi:benzoylformate decarboxylase
VVRGGAFDDAVALAERLRAPVWQDAIPALTGFPQDHPLFRGHLPFAQRCLAETLSGHDVVLVLGAPVFLYYPYVPGSTVEEGTRVFQLPDDLEGAIRAAVGTSVVGDVGAAIRSLNELLPEAERPLPEGRKKPPVPEAITPMSVEYVMHELSKALPEDTVVFDEAISSKPLLHKHVRLNRAGAYHTAVSGGLGFAMPASVGFKLAVPERPVVCVIGRRSGVPPVTGPASPLSSTTRATPSSGPSATP